MLSFLPKRLYRRIAVHRAYSSSRLSVSIPTIMPYSTRRESKTGCVLEFETSCSATLVLAAAGQAARCWILCVVDGCWFMDRLQAKRQAQDELIVGIDGYWWRLAFQ